MRASFAQHAAGGPLLQELLEAQHLDEAAVAYPSIERIAQSLVLRARALAAVVWPVGAAAERIAGAATLLAEGDIEIAARNRRLDGERVLVFAVSGATPLSLAAAGAQVRSMGAAEVHACGVGVAGADSCDAWQSFIALEAAATRMLQSALHAS